MKLSAIVSVAGAFLLSGCAKELSSKVAQDRIYTSYRVAYDDTSRELTSSALFTFGGATGTFLELDGSSSIMLNGTALEKVDTVFNSVYYERKLTSPTQAQVDAAQVFVYTDNDGKKYTNTFPALGLVRAQIPATVSAATDWTFSWTATTAWGTEWLKLKYSGKKTDGKVSAGNEPLPIPSPSATTGNVTLSAEKLKTWGAGTYKVQLCREASVSKPTEAPTAGGAVSVTSCSAQADLKVTAQ